MRPTIGRIIHTAFPGLPCQAAIVTALDYGAGKADTMFVTVMHPHSAPTNATILLPSDSWHDPRACPNITAPEYQDIKADDDHGLGFGGYPGSGLSELEGESS